MPLGDLFSPPSAPRRFAFDFAFLTVTDHPVDPQRGWPIGEAVFTLAANGSGIQGADTRTGTSATARRHYVVGVDCVDLCSSAIAVALLCSVAAREAGRYLLSSPCATFPFAQEGLAVQLPTPDFSMLYNAMMLASTLISLAVTSYLALVTRSVTALFHCPEVGRELL